MRSSSFHFLIPVLTILFLQSASAYQVDNGFRYVKGDGFVTIVGYEGTQSSVIFPDSFEGLPARVVNFLVGPGVESLVKVTVPEGYETIAKGAFFNATHLQEVVLPSSITAINTWAFMGCENLEKVNLPDGLQLIGLEAFRNCRNLKSIEIPQSLVAFGYSSGSLSRDYGLFSGCSGLEAFTVDPDNPVFSSDNGVLYSKEKEVLIQYPGGRQGAFVVPDFVERIAEDAFRDCLGLTFLTLSSDVQLGYPTTSSFSSCYRLEGIVIEDSSVTNSSSLFRSADGILYDQNFTTVYWVPTVDPGVWQIPNGIEIIVPDAISGWTGLTSLILPPSLKSLESFSGCTNLSSFQLSGEHEDFSVQDGVLFSKDGSVLIRLPQGFHGHYTIPAGVTEIGNGAFGGCTGLSGITIPDSVVRVGKSAFAGCTELTTLQMPGVETIGESAFRNCEGLESIDLPSSFEGIMTAGGDIDRSFSYFGTRLFDQCINLTSVFINSANPQFMNMGDGIIEREEKSLLYLPSGLSGAVNLAEGITEIRSGAIPSFSKLESLSLPASLTGIQPNAISSFNQNLSAIQVAKNHPSFTSVDGVLFSKDQKTLILYPPGRENGHYTISNGVEEAEDNGLSCHQLSSLTIPASFQDSFSQELSHLVSVTVHSEQLTLRMIQSIGEQQSLTSVIFPERHPDFTSLEGAIASEDGLHLFLVPSGNSGRYTIPRGIRFIDRGALDNSFLTEIVIPPSVYSIQSRDIFSSSSLRKMSFEGNEPVVPTSRVTIDSSVQYYEGSLRRTDRFPSGVSSLYSFPTEAIESPGRWAKASSRADGWKALDWFGSFLEYESGWTYHSELGWLWIEGSTESNLHAFIPELNEWLVFAFKLSLFIPGWK